MTFGWKDWEGQRLDRDPLPIVILCDLNNLRILSILRCYFFLCEKKYNKYSRDCGWPRRPWPNAERKKFFLKNLLFFVKNKNYLKFFVLLHISSSYAKILGETNFHAREIPRSGWKVEGGEEWPASLRPPPHVAHASTPGPKVIYNQRVQWLKWKLPTYGPITIFKTNLMKNAIYFKPNPEMLFQKV